MVSQSKCLEFSFTAKIHTAGKQRNGMSKFDYDRPQNKFVPISVAESSFFVCQLWNFDFSEPNLSTCFDSAVPVKTIHFIRHKP